MGIKKRKYIITFLLLKYISWMIEKGISSLWRLIKKSQIKKESFSLYHSKCLLFILLQLDTLDPRANIIDVYIWMLFDDVLALASSIEKNYVM